MGTRWTLLDRLAGAGALINAFPLGLLFLAWPTSVMMWMVSPDWFGVGVMALSVASNSVIYAGTGRRGEASNEASIDVNRRTSQCNRPGRALLASATDRERSRTPLKR